MDNERQQRIAIIDKMLSKGRPVSFQEIAVELDNVFHKIKGNPSPTLLNGYYNTNFRKDMEIIRGILGHGNYGLSPEMLLRDCRLMFSI